MAQDKTILKESLEAYILCDVVYIEVLYIHIIIHSSSLYIVQGYNVATIV